MKSINDDVWDGRKSTEERPLLDDVLEPPLVPIEKQWHRPRMTFLMIFLIIHFISFGFSLSMTYLRMVDLFKRTGLDNTAAVAQATIFNGYLGAIKGSGTFLLSPVFGKISDRIGRKPLFFVSLLSTAFDTSAYIVGEPMWIFFISKAVLGLTDSMYTTGMAAMIDVTPTHRRAFGFAMFGVGFGLSMIGWPALAGFVADKTSFNMVFYISLGIDGLALITLLLMPETNRNKVKRPIYFSDFVPLSNFTFLFRNFHTKFLAFILVILSFSLEGIMDSFSPWLKFKFPNQSNFMMGTISSVAGAGLMMSAPITHFILPRLGKKKSICMSIATGTAGLVTLVFVTEWWQLYPLILLRSLAFVSNPTLQAMLCAHYSPEEQAPLVGILISLKTIPSVIGPFVFPKIFSYFIEHDPKIPEIVFYIVGIMNSFILVCCVVYFIFVKSPKTKQITPKDAYASVVVESPTFRRESLMQ
ncbi:hypothetical protein PROFUN_05721 [Planoprotostelium fungivorum]|uniref:Major facilitator superfamily (MFS) profile domain-containing protein n=1 Tax=Planoprotostelium fungivorum TaxID=1890364 RepID=A0A2P6NQI0_9EUKA|nr:hypothetical protein PROFUN_05721 [Planoprotostelium fungivorum]